MSVRVTIVGNVGKDPVFKVSAGGKSYATFGIATWTGKKGEDRWWKIMAFGPHADEVARLVRRGSYIEVEGRFDYSEREWEGKRYQDFICFSERVTEKEKPIKQVPSPEQPAEIEKPMVAWGKAHEASLLPDSPRDPFDRENHYSSGSDIDFSRIPF